RPPPPLPTRRSSDLARAPEPIESAPVFLVHPAINQSPHVRRLRPAPGLLQERRVAGPDAVVVAGGEEVGAGVGGPADAPEGVGRSEEHTSELQSLPN